MKSSVNKKRARVKYFGKLILPLLLVSLLSVSCGSSGSGSASGGIGGTGISQGTIEGFGSVIVNGVTFNTAGAGFTIDDSAGAQSDLAVGMVVNVTVGTDGTTASNVEFESEVEGPVSARDDNDRTLTVLGRTVVVDDNTKIEDPTGTAVAFSTLANDDMLEVSGLVFTDDSIQATYIRRLTNTFVSGGNVETKGKINSFISGTSFKIGTQLISYTNSTPLVPTTLTLANGLLVEVEGTFDGTTLTAAKIKQEDAFGAANGLKVEIEGVVDTTGFTDDTSFSVNGQAVTTSSTTVFEDGARDDIAISVRLEVEGTMTNSVLVATKVKFRGNRVKIEGLVEGAPTPGPNTVTIFGIPIRINSVTDMRDGIAFGTISNDKHLAIRGYVTGTVVVATRVEDGDKIILQAPVDSINNPDDLTLLGVKVITPNNAVFQNLLDATIDRATFFNQVTTGGLVKVKGALTNPKEITATEVELED